MDWEVSFKDSANLPTNNIEFEERHYFNKNDVINVLFLSLCKIKSTLCKIKSTFNPKAFHVGNRYGVYMNQNVSRFFGNTDSQWVYFKELHDAVEFLENKKKRFAKILKSFV